MRITDFPLIEEVKNEYIENRRNGNSRQSATELVTQCYMEELLDKTSDDAVFVWIGLADGQYQRKELTEQIAAIGMNALNWLESANYGITPGDISRRRMHYAQAPMPEKAVGKPKKKFQCSWAIGDTFAYQLSGALAEAEGIAGRYVLFRKVGEMSSNGKTEPSVTVTLWDERPLPQNSQEFCQIPFMILDQRKLLIPKGCFEYRTRLIIKNQKQLEKVGLRYLGNFPDVQTPRDEAILTFPGEDLLLLLDYLDRDCCYLYKMHCHIIQGIQGRRSDGSVIR